MVWRRVEWATVGRRVRGFVADHAHIIVPAAIASAIAAVLYLSTLMWSISGCSAEYCADAGEFQVALPNWGTVHSTGYPLYMLLGSPFVTLLHMLGIAPAAGASLYSLVWEALAVAGLAGLITWLTGNGLLGMASALLFGVFEPIWVYGSLAKEYSLSMVLALAVVGLTLRLGQHWSERGGWLLAFVGGLGLAHHRLIGVLLLAVGLYLLPTAWRHGRFGRWLAVATACFVAGFAPYLDLPVRVWRGSTWNYDQVNTWAGFWRIFFAGEVAGQQAPLSRLPALVVAGQDSVASLARIMTWPGLVIALVAGAIAVAQRNSRSKALFLVGGLIAFFVFSAVFPRAVFLGGVLMVPLALIVLLAALGLSQLGRLSQVAAAVVVGIWAAGLAWQNYGFVAGLTRDPAGVNYIARVAQLDAPPGGVVMAPWGERYFALAYAQRVDKQLLQWTVVDHRADMATLATQRNGIYTEAGTLYVFGLDWWALRLGSPLRLTSAGPSMIHLVARPLPAPTHAPLVIGDGIGLEGCEVHYGRQAQDLQVILYWVAQRATRTDYSTYVYASDQASIVTLGDLVAQSDSSAPVDGWYPTSRWQADEVIREDHVLTIPLDRPARYLFAGMYARDAAGRFIQLGRVRLVRSNGGDCQPQQP